jgi:hypothetical protein
MNDTYQDEQSQLKEQQKQQQEDRLKQSEQQGRDEKTENKFQLQLERLQKIHENEMNENKNNEKNNEKNLKNSYEINLKNLSEMNEKINEDLKIEINSNIMELNLLKTEIEILNKQIESDALNTNNHLLSEYHKGDDYRTYEIEKNQLIENCEKRLEDMKGAYDSEQIKISRDFSQQVEVYSSRIVEMENRYQQQV